METWRPILNLEGIYSISSRGRVRRDIPGQSTYKGKILKAAISPTGYLFVGLIKNKEHFVKRIHLLVARAFLGEKPKGMVTDHIDRNKQNNNLNNLRYTSQSVNCFNSQRGDMWKAKRLANNEKRKHKLELYKLVKEEIEANNLTLSQIASNHDIPYITVYSWKNNLRNRYFTRKL